jgi:hypothetical protein
MDNQALISWILRVAVGTLASIILIVIAALMIGLFLPNSIIDNNMIFPIIGPAFNTVIGAFVGLLGGLSLNSKGEFAVNQSKKEDITNEPSQPTD